MKNGGRLSDKDMEDAIFYHNYLSDKFDRATADLIIAWFLSSERIN